MVSYTYRRLWPLVLSFGIYDVPSSHHPTPVVTGRLARTCGHRRVSYTAVGPEPESQAPPGSLVPWGPATYFPVFPGCSSPTRSSFPSIPPFTGTPFLCSSDRPLDARPRNENESENENENENENEKGGEKRGGCEKVSGGRCAAIDVLCYLLGRHCSHPAMSVEGCSYLAVKQAACGVVCAFPESVLVSCVG